MRIEGAIRPLGTPRSFTCEAWCKLIEHRPEFRRYPSHTGHNPFTCSSITLPRPRDCVEVVQEGSVVGKAYWSMSEEPLVNVCVEEIALPLVLEWAEALGGEFSREWRGLLAD